MVTLIRSASLWAMAFLMVALGACDRPSQDGGSDQPAEIPPPNTAVTPRFVGDSALALVRTQVGFGPRIPGSASHRRCGDWMVAALRERGLQVVEQRESLTMHDGKVFELRNIVGVLMAVGAGDKPPQWVADVLAARSRSAASVTAKPYGLYLVAVDYPAIHELPQLLPGPLYFPELLGDFSR